MSNLLKRLREDARQGCDLSPGNDLSGEAADEIERFERELGDTKERLADAIRSNVAIGCQCAAMRVALERIASSDLLNMNTLHPDACPRIAKAALSPDAGAKLLRVVERLEGLIEAIDKGALK